MPKIKRVQLFRAVSPLSRPIADSTHQLSEISFLIARLETDTGVTGSANLLSFHYSPQAILGALRDVREFALGWPVNETGRFIRQFEIEAEYFGISGIHRWSLGLLNIAMWDAWAKSLGQPVWRLFGTCHDRIPVYGSGGWLSYSIEELLDEVRGYAGRGFRAVKVKVGSPTVAQDIERLTRVREAVGPNIKIMMDANQGMTLSAALDLARSVRELGITWFEEPLPHTDFDGYAQLRKQAGMMIAMGEREFDTLPLRELVRREGIDLWQPDILRLGGVEAWRQSAALAGAHHIPVLPHYYKEYDVPLLMTVPNAYGAESFDWIDPLLTHPLRIEAGYAYPHARPGWGFEFKEEALREV